jgi:signal transduction histidine kinase
MERVEHGLLRLDLREVDIREAIGKAAQYVPGVPVVIEAHGALKIRADPERLEQMLVNLIANAGRHGQPPIAVAAHSTGSQIRITVRDHGPGVPEAARPMLFARFTSDDPSGQSVGLGLWIVHQLALAHGGTVHYEAAQPGACFVITLPANPKSASP